MIKCRHLAGRYVRYLRRAIGVVVLQNVERILFNSYVLLKQLEVLSLLLLHFKLVPQ